MLRFPRVGDKVKLFHKSNGAGKMESFKNFMEDTVKHVYSDGAVSLCGSGEVWNVSRNAKGEWVTTTFQKRKHA